MKKNKLFFPGIMLLIFMSNFVLSHLGMAAGNSLKQIYSTSLPDNRVKLRLDFAQTLTVKPKHFIIKEPVPRIVVDFSGVSNKLVDSKASVALGMVHSYSVVEAGNRTRLVLDLNEAVGYSVETSGSSIAIIINGAPPSAGVVSKNSMLGRMQRKSKSSNHQYSINNVDFKRDKDGGGRIIIGVSSEKIAANVREQGNKVIVDFINASLPQRLQHRYDVTDFDTPVDAMDVEHNQSGARLTAVMHNEYRQFAYQIDKNFIVDIKPISADEVVVREPRYSGKRLSLNFQDVKLRAVLQVLAEFTGINIVVSDSVTGNITIRLDNVPWDQVLDIILKTRGLDKRKIGNVMLVAPAAEIMAREKQDIQAQQQVTELEPLRFELSQINYAKASDIASLLQDDKNSLLSTRGSVTVDTRTNTLWIQETPSRLVEIRRVIQRLDIPVRQVLIEARVVNVDRGFDRELGVRFGLTNENANLSGSFAAANTIEAGTEPKDLTLPENRLNFNLPQTLDSAETSGRIGLALANLGGGFLLDLELSAMESEGKGETISNPRLVTANQQPAMIEAGQEIPYQQTTSSGATSVAFKKAVLRLEVTPQITPDDKIILNLKVNQDKRSNSEQDVLGVPSIDTRHIETQVLVNNGETIVLGGIYEIDKKKTVLRIPILGSIPLIGYFFRNTVTRDSQKELLIFVTPKIITQPLHQT